VEGQHYLHLDVSYRPNAAVSIDESTVADRIEGWLASDGLTAAISHNNARYFDDYLMPEAIGRHILQYVSSTSAS
jgi:hypothetical protein